MRSAQALVGAPVGTLTDIEAQLIAAYRQFRSVVWAGGNPTSIVAAEAAFLECAESVCDMTRAPGVASGADSGHDGGQQMADQDEKDQNHDDEGQRTTAQGDGDRGDGTKNESPESGEGTPEKE